MFNFIDYSETYFKTIAKKPIPSRRGGKFVQIVNHSTGDEYLVLSPKKLSEFHANIVERFCLLNGNIKGSNNEKSTFFKIQDPAWEVIGGGKWEIDVKERTLLFYGESQAYGTFKDLDLKKKVGLVDGMGAVTVTIAAP